MDKELDHGIYLIRHFNLVKSWSIAWSPNPGGGRHRWDLEACKHGLSPDRAYSQVPYDERYLNADGTAEISERWAIAPTRFLPAERRLVGITERFLPAENTPPPGQSQLIRDRRQTRPGGSSAPEVTSGTSAC